MALTPAAVCLIMADRTDHKERTVWGTIALVVVVVAAIALVGWAADWWGDDADTVDNDDFFGVSAPADNEDSNLTNSTDRNANGGIYG